MIGRIVRNTVGAMTIERCVRIIFGTKITAVEVKS